MILTVLWRKLLRSYDVYFLFKTLKEHSFDGSRTPEKAKRLFEYSCMLHASMDYAWKYPSEWIEDFPWIWKVFMDNGGTETKEDGDDQ